MPTPLTTSAEVATAQAATVTPVADLLVATQQLVNFTLPAEDLPTAAKGSATLGRIESKYATLLAAITGLPAAILALAQMLQALLPGLDHLTMTLSSSSVVETATPPTLTLGQWQTGDSSTPYTDTLSPANAFSSSAPSVATINATTGVITLHGPGTTTFTRTAGGKTVTADLTVTAEILSSTPSSLSGAIGGASAALVIKDQSGVDVTSGCTFASSNTAIATVNSSGVVTYVAAGTATITATHTVDGETCTTGVTVAGSAPVIGSLGQNIMGAVSTAVPITNAWDAARIYTGVGYASPDDEWHKKNFQNTAPAPGDNYYFNSASPTLGGVVGSSAKYAYGNCQCIDIVDVVAASIIGGMPAFRFKWEPCTGSPNGAIGGSPPSAQMISNLPTTSRRVWMGRRVAHAKGSQVSGGHDWDTTGSECVLSANTTFNSTGGGAGPGFKDGPYIQSTNITTARCGVSGFVNATYGGVGLLEGQYQLDGDFENDGASPAVIMGFTDQAATTASTIDDSMNDGLVYDVGVLCELFPDGSGNDWTATRYWRRIVNSDFSVGPWKRVGSYVVADMFDTNGGTGWHNGFVFDQVQFTSKNHNRAIEAPRYRDISEWAAFDATNPNADGSDDPWGCLSHDAATASAVLSAASLTSTAVGSALFSLTRTTSTAVPSYTSKIRMVVNGTDNSSSLDYAVPATLRDTDSFDLTWTQAVGTYNVQFKTVSADGTQVSSAYPTTPISVVIPASLIPLAPTQTNATAATPNSLTFPVTLNSAGALPTALPWQYSKDGGSTWSAGIDIPLSSPTLGQVVTVVVPCDTPAQLYNVQFAEKNTNGTSAWSTKTTGTTSTSANTAKTALVMANSGAPFKPAATLSSVLPLATNAGGLSWKNFNAAVSGGATPYVYSAAGTGTQSLQFGGWVSDGLVAGTIAAGNWTVALGLYEESAGSSYNLAFSLKVWRPLTQSVVGTIYDSATGLGSALTTQATGGKVITVAGSAVTVQDGDVLVFEVYAVGTGGQAYIHLAFGGSGTTITEGCDLTTYEHAVLSFPANITFEV